MSGGVCVVCTSDPGRTLWVPDFIAYVAAWNLTRKCVTQAQPDTPPGRRSQQTTVIPARQAVAGMRRRANTIPEREPGMRGW